VTPEVPGDLRPLLAEIARRARDVNAEPYLVGGAVRDLFLKRSFVDVDVAVQAEPATTLALADALASELGGRVKATHDRFGTATVELEDGRRLDLATTRAESYPYPGSLPVITGRASLEEDLARRDFSVHALAAPLSMTGEIGDVRDPLGGGKDLDARVLRLLHRRSLADDPTRAIRAARYGARLGFSWGEGFGPALEASREASAWRRISGDRLRRSLEEALAEDGREEAFERLRAAGILDDVAAGWGRVPRAAIAGDDLPERWRALLGPADGALRRSVASRLNFSRALSRAAEAAR
jgi:tRNA nucleotidyltransferase (CCA-adding enzyme)